MEHSKKTVFTKQTKQPNPVRESVLKVNIEKPPSACTDNTHPEVVCPACKLSSKNLMSLKVHIENIHSNPKTAKTIDSCDVITSNGNDTFIKCPHCDFVGTKSAIEDHIAKKHGFVVICGECGSKFPVPRACVDHIDEMYLLPQKCEPFPCEECGWTYLES